MALTPAEIQKRYRKRHPERVKARRKADYAANREKRINQVLASRAKNYDKFIEYSRRYEKENRESRNEKARAFFKNNPHIRTINDLKKKIVINQATPVWSDKDKLKKIYKLRNRLNTKAGYIKYHVDHVIPLRGKLVSGLHIIDNLKIVLAEYNRTKHNKYEVAI